MAEISSYDRVRKNPPKVPTKVSNSAPQKENNGSTTPVDSNGRPIAKPRNVPKSLPRSINSPPAEQKGGILLPCFGEYKAQNAFNQKSRRPYEPPTASEDAVNVVSPIVTSEAKLPPTPSTLKTEHERKKSPILPTTSGKQKITDKVLYGVPIRPDKLKLPATSGTPGTYRLLTLPPAIGKPSRKPAMLPNVELERFNIVASRNFYVKNEDLSVHVIT